MKQLQLSIIIILTIAFIAGCKSKGGIVGQIDEYIKRITSDSFNLELTTISMHNKPKQYLSLIFKQELLNQFNFEPKLITPINKNEILLIIPKEVRGKLEKKLKNSQLFEQIEIKQIEKATNIQLKLKLKKKHIQGTDAQSSLLWVLSCNKKKECIEHHLNNQANLTEKNMKLLSRLETPIVESKIFVIGAKKIQTIKNLAKNSQPTKDIKKTSISIAAIPKEWLLESIKSDKVFSTQKNWLKPEFKPFVYHSSKDKAYKIKSGQITFIACKKCTYSEYTVTYPKNKFQKATPIIANKIASADMIELANTLINRKQLMIEVWPDITSTNNKQLNIILPEQVNDKNSTTLLLFIANNI